MIVKWFKKGAEFEQEGLKLREDILSSTMNALTSELTRLEVCRALVKAGYPREKVKETFATLSEMESLGFVTPVRLAGLANEAISLILGLNLYVADSLILASAIVTSSTLLTEDKHLLKAEVRKMMNARKLKVLRLEGVYRD